MEAASGIASLMKTALALKHKTLPPNLHFHTPNPDIPFDTMPLRVSSDLKPWPDADHPRLAGVNAFGFGGSNSHVVLEEPPASLPSLAERGAEGVGGNGSHALANSPHPNPLPAGEGTRQLLPLSARTETALQDLARRYGEFLIEETLPWNDVCYTAAARREHHDCRLAVLADSPEDAVDLLQSYLVKPETADHVFVGRKPYDRALKIAFVYDDRLDHWKPHIQRLAQNVPGFAATLETTTGRSLDDLLNEKENDRTTLLALQLAMTAWWRGLGIVPDVVLGKGVGEFAAAYAAGVLTAEEVLHFAVNGGRDNGGPPKSRAAALPMLSAVDGKAHSGQDLNATHWQACLRGECQQFATALGALQERNIDIYLTIGPKSLENENVRFLPSLSSSDTEEVDVLTAIGTLYAAGADICWRRLATAGSRPVHVPTYPWQRQKLWALKRNQQVAARVEKSPDSKTESNEAQEYRRRSELTTPYVGPRTPLETTLAESWSSMLRIDRVGIHDNFFELGGDSLQAAILLNLIPSKLGRPISLPLRDLFHTPTIAALAGRIEEALAGETVTSQPSLVSIPRDGELPLSFNQEALWFLDRLEPNRPTYMLHLALNVRGPLDISALERALNEIVRRHESLRTTFPEVNDRPVQVIAPPKPQSLPVVDLSDVPESEREARLRRRIAEEMNQPIDLQNGPLIRILLLRRGENDYAVVASTHHIVHDGWSMGILLHELAVLYVAYANGGESPLPDLPIQYVDFSAWQRKLLQGETLERLRTFWREQLSGVPALELPTDHPRPAVRTTRGSSRPCRLSRETSDAVLEYCRREGITPFMVLLAAFKVLLMRHAGQADFAVGVPVANRNRPETESLIGYFVNVVVLRNEMSGEITFREAIDRVRKTALDAFERQEMTLDQVVDAVSPTRDPSRNPLFQAMFALQNIRLPSPPKLDLTISPLDDSPAPPSSNFDLTLELFDRDEGFSGGMSFSTDLFEPETVDRMIEQYQVLVAAAVKEPEQKIASLPLLRDEQSQMMIDRWNDTARDYDRTRLVRHLFENHAARQPDATAVVLNDRRWSYGELNRRANQFAHYLQRLGVGPETRVGVCLERSPELIATVLGVMKAGGAYVPLDPAYTRDAEERVKYILQDAQVSWVATNAQFSASVNVGDAQPIVLDGEAADAIRSESEDNLDPNATADGLAYILYTSGSTGRPKGVMVTHGNLLNAYYGWEQDYHLDSEVHSHLQMASFGFDVFGGDLVRALCSGGKLVICPKEVLLDPQELLGLIERETIDIAEFVPVILRTLIQQLEDTGRTLDTMRMVIAGSDAWYVADQQRARAVLGSHTRLLNSYGLTETTIDSCYFEGDVESVAPNGLVPIGRPFVNVRLYVLDDSLRPTPIGVPGELYIGGDGVSRGYVDDRLNAARFPQDPFAMVPGARMCRTGDRARRRADGQIEFLGRADNQVKIRGFRIEPSEVEQVLREHPMLAEAAVVARERTPGDMRLVAYSIAREGESPTPAEMRRFLRERLPEYMVPSAFVAIAAMPVTNSGKTDRRALPAPDWSDMAGDSEFVAPRTPIEQQLASIWSELLSVERVGVGDSFFDLGGNSLLVLRLVSRIRSAFSIDLPLVTAFSSPTLGELATEIESLQAKGCLPDLPPIQRIPRDGPLLASFGQERFWFLQQQ
jgi:amino acid adenylation domain-containing protein